MTKEIFIRTLCAILALHLHRFIGELGILEDFTVKSDQYVVLKTQSTLADRIELYRLIYDESFRFDLYFADVYPYSWFPSLSGQRPSKEELCKVIEEVGGRGSSPFNLIPGPDLWKYTIGLHLLSDGCNSSPGYNSQHLSKAQALIKQ